MENALIFLDGGIFALEGFPLSSEALFPWYIIRFVKHPTEDWEFEKWDVHSR